MDYPNIPEEELKIRVGEDYFSGFDHAKKIGKVDFCLSPRPPKGEIPFQEQSLLWAEAKANRHDVVAMFAQLILTIGKARTFNLHLPPAFLGAFDAEKIAFVPYDKVQHLFFENDFNWNVTPSDHSTKEFAEIKSLISNILESEKHLYFFGKDDKELRFFIKNSLANTPFGGRGDGKIQIDKNNFVSIYLRWLDEVKPLINFDFEEGRKRQILDSDFYLADLFVDDRDTATIDDDVSVRDDMFVFFQNEGYKIARKNIGQLYDATIAIRQKAAYENFWKRYKRPPIHAFQNYIIERRDLLVPQDIRERKGAFFTPRRWVELSQKYIADVLGADWQDEWYVWDCAAGTGNLLAGLTNKRNIFASTLDPADVQVMKERIKNGANLFEQHIFQFDFLNDAFFDEEKDTYDIDTGRKIGKRSVKSRLPENLQEILRDPAKRKKLVVYINPPYAEVGSNAGSIGKIGVQQNRIHDKYQNVLKASGKELFAQFLLRIYSEIPDCTIANFSKLKNLQSPNFLPFRKGFKARLKRLFLIPASTFDNVTGVFPIGFFVWDTKEKEDFVQIVADVYDGKGNALVNKTIVSHQGGVYINNWLRKHSKWIEPEPIHAKDRENIHGTPIGHISSTGNDFQNQNRTVIDGRTSPPFAGGRHVRTLICGGNLIVVSVYFAVRHCIAATWLNDRDQFLWPMDSWESDLGFHNDCLVFTLFHSQNRISAKAGTNHWIPFTEDEAGANGAFASTFMSDFIAGKIKKTNGNGDLFNKPKVENGAKCRFSPEAQAVFDAGKEIWKYYHSQKEGINVNASLYDIRDHFQGRNEKGTMNNKSTDEKYNELIGTLREKLSVLAGKIAEKVYEHGFLKA